MTIIKVLKGLFILLVGISSILAAYYSHQGLDLQKGEILKESTPFFKYRYSEDSKAFVVESEENVSIHSLRWFFPVTEKSFYGFQKYSNLLTIDEIIFVIWSAFLDHKIFIPSPDSLSNTADYIRCSVLAVFDEYNSAIETDTGFPMGVLIEYTRKGENKSYFGDIVLIKDFDNTVPQIKIAKTNIMEDDIKLYMKKGAERLDDILPIYPYDQNKTYIDDNSGGCSQTSTSWNKYFFNEADREEMLQPFREND